MSRRTRQLTNDQIRIGATAGIAHVAIALVAPFAVPVSLAPRLSLVADPWFRRETGAVNGGFAYGLLQVARGRRDPTSLRATAISGLLMATVRAVATLRGQRCGVLSAIVIGSDLPLGIGGWSGGNSTATTRPPGRRDSTPRSHNDARQCTVAVT